MSEPKEMKKIDLQTLESAERTISSGKLKKAATAFALLLVFSGGGWAAYRAVTGEIVASRFTVNRMNCPACVITVKEVTERIPGVIGTDVSLAAQEVTVRYREKQTGPEAISGAISKAGYPIQLDGVFRINGQGIDRKVVAVVNGRPIFRSDIAFNASTDADMKNPEVIASAFFTAVGKELLLQTADTKPVCVQPHEVEALAESIRNKLGLTPDALAQYAQRRFGSGDKFRHMLAQEISIRKLLEEHVLEGTKSRDDAERKALAWAGSIFKDTEVRILDADLRAALKAAAGQDDWKLFWPVMIGRNTELKRLLSQQEG